MWFVATVMVAVAAGGTWFMMLCSWLAGVRTGAELGRLGSKVPEQCLNPPTLPERFARRVCEGRQ